METPTPPLPTDNLYKFQALAGLVILMLSIWFGVERYYEICVESVKINGETDKLSLEITNLMESLDHLERQTSRIIKTNDASTVSLSTIGLSAIDFGKRLDDVKKIDMDIRVKGVEEDTHFALFKIQANQLRTIVKFSVIGGCLGIYFTVWGFYRWQTRVQDYQDRILRKEAEEEAPKPHKHKHDKPQEPSEG
jgi:hypothetical protein